MASLLQTFAEQGYAATTIADVARQAKISLTTFYAFFAGKQEALLAVLDHIRETAGNAARAGRARRPESWRSTVRDGLEALLGALDAEPALARVALAEPGIEPRARDHGCSTLALDTVLCPEHPEAPPITPTANAAIGGAILTLIARPAPGHGARSFSASTPVATYVALAPFIGPANACSTANEPRATPP